MGSCSTKEPERIDSRNMKRMLIRKDSMRCIPFSRQDLISRGRLDFEKQYEIEDKIELKYQREGFHVVRHKGSGLIRLAKFIDPKNLTSKERDKIWAEFELFRTLDFPLLLGLLESYDSPKSIVLVFEFSDGVDLLEHFAKKQHFNEHQVAEIIRQIFLCLAFLASKNVVHGGLNFSSITVENDWIKFCSFQNAFDLVKNSSGVFKPESIDSEPSDIFVAPEVKDSGVSFSSDVYSVGIMMYICFEGTVPFEPDFDPSLRTPKFFQNLIDKLKVSQNCKDLLNGLLCEPDKRITAKDALAHPWLKSIESGIALKKSLIYENFRLYQIKTPIQEAIFLFIVINFAKEVESRTFTNLFFQLDKDKDGEISFDELMYELSNIKNKELIEMILSSIDRAGTKRIKFTNFLAAMISKSNLLKDEVIFNAFRLMDYNNTGRVGVDQLKTIFSGKDLSKNDWIELIKLVDSNGDGEVCLKDRFYRIQQYVEKSHSTRVIQIKFLCSLILLFWK